MKKITILLSIMMLSGAMLFTGCQKDNSPVPPTVLLKSAEGFISADAQAAYGEKLQFGITTKSNGTDKLVKFTVYVNDKLLKDSTLKNDLQDFAITITASKSILDTEVWKFVTTDIAGNVGTSSVTITGKFGEINTYPAITLGAQNNTAVESFLSFKNNAATKYFQGAAFDHQADIDMFCFYEYSVDHPNYMSLAGPGSNISGIFTGTTAPANYLTKNATFFEKTTLTAAQFDAVVNDAVVLASFNPNPALKRKKASVLTVGDVYAFMLQSGKFGLLKITVLTPAPSGSATGSLDMAVKIQK